MDIQTIMDNKDFLQPLLDMMNKRSDDLAARIDANTAQTNKVLEQVGGMTTELDAHDKAIKRLETARGKKPFTLSPQAIYLVALAFVLLLAIIATVLHINIGGLTK